MGVGEACQSFLVVVARSPSTVKASRPFEKLAEELMAVALEVVWTPKRLARNQIFARKSNWSEATSM